LLLLKTNYAEFSWYVCGDFKMLVFCWVSRVAIPNTLVFFACGTTELMESRVLREDPLAAKARINTRKVQCHQGVTCKRGKSFITPLHIKLGLVKQFVKVLDIKGETFQVIRAMIPKMSDAKLKGGIFVGPK